LWVLLLLLFGFAISKECHVLVWLAQYGVDTTPFIHKICFLTSPVSLSLLRANQKEAREKEWIAGKVVHLLIPTLVWDKCLIKMCL
jgi:hypothetical protein